MADDFGLIETISSQSNRSSQQLTSETDLAEKFDNFLTILTTQLQNQDPLSPLDTHEFTNQFVMFADVEQLVRQSGLMEDLIAVNTQNQVTAALGHIGQYIEADHNEFNFEGEPVTVKYEMPETAAAANMEIYDENDQLVAIVTGIEKDIGEHEFTWDGLDINGDPVAPGAYSFQVGALNENEQPIWASYTTNGMVTGVEFESGSAVLMMGDVRIPTWNVLSVVEEQPSA